MTISTQKLYDEALLLSEPERADLAACLLATLDTDKILDESWEQEIEKRIKEIDQGRVALVPWKEARSRIFGNG